MKLNKKGFMMAEVVVVSAIILIFMGTIYVSYNKMLSAYKTRLSYLDVVTLYRLGYYRDILIENKAMDNLISKASTDNVVDIYDSTNGMNSIFNLSPTEETDNKEDRVLLIKKDFLSQNCLDSKENINPTFKDYVSYMTSAVTIDSNYVMVMERCNPKTGTIKDDKKVYDECQYAYLEIYDGKE